MPRQRGISDRPTGDQLSLQPTPTFSQRPPRQQVPLPCSPSTTQRNFPADLDEFKDADFDAGYVDSGLQVGRLKIPEKIEGISRLQIATQINDLLFENNELDPLFTLQPAISGSVVQTSTFSHGASSSLPSPPDRSWSESSDSFLPITPAEAHFLYCQYFASVDPLAHVIHKPSFELAYHDAMAYSPVLVSSPPPFRALALTVYLAAAMSLSPAQSRSQFRDNKIVLVGRLKAAAEKALADANYMTSVKIQTLQAFVVYLIPQCRASVPKSNTILVRRLVRLAEHAGLHCTTAGTDINPVEQQTRLWLSYQICFLDLRVAEVYGPQPIIQDDKFNFPLPLNIDDTALHLCSGAPVEVYGWTDATFCRLRYECHKIQRSILRLRQEVNNGQVDLREARILVEKWKKDVQKRYLDYLDEKIPIQRCAKLVGRILTARFDFMLLYKHLGDNRSTGIQRDLHEILAVSSLIICENAITLETDKDLALWAWYAGAYQQYHAAVFLLMEIYSNPTTPHAAQINAVLDHVFGVTPGISSQERNRDTLRLIAKEINQNLNRNTSQSTDAAVDGGSFGAMPPYPIVHNDLGSDYGLGIWQPYFPYTEGYPWSPDLPYRHAYPQYGPTAPLNSYTDSFLGQDPIMMAPFEECTGSAPPLNVIDPGYYLEDHCCCDAMYEYLKIGTDGSVTGKGMRCQCRNMGRKSGCGNA